MLKGLTFGQFYPDNTPAHQLDPRTKLIAVIVYIVALFVAKSYVSYAVLLAVLLVAIRISKVSFSAILKSVKPLVVIIIFTAILNVFFTKGTQLLVSFWRIRIYAEGVRTAVFMVVRILMLITGTFLLTYTTSPIALTDGLELLLAPLKKLRVPVHELSMMMSIALRFIPTLIEETDKIMSAQKARGADFETGNVLEKAKSLIPLLVPLFVSAFRRADELATAMESRCYHGDKGRTRMRRLIFQKGDILTFAAFAAVCGTVIALAHFGL